MKRSLLSLLLLCMSSAFLIGCNTVEGAGKDIQAAGEEIEEAAD